jgi:aminoglycoside 3-N-acetyltransferase
MSEADAVARSTRGPVTRQWLRRDLQALGVRPGMLLMVHTSLSQLGWVIGGPVTVVDALRDAVGESGTLVMPTFSSWNGEPSRWRHPPVQDSWWQTIREQMPPYDPRTAPTREMGAVPEYFRTLPGAHRSSHPSASWAALGPLAAEITRNHSLDMCQGEESPMGRCYQLGGHVLSLATVRTTILHLAEYHAGFPARQVVERAAAVLVEGERRWLTYEDIEGDESDFEQIRQDFMASRPAADDSWHEVPIAYASSRLLAIRPLVDFAVSWMEQHRR